MNRRELIKMAALPFLPLGAVPPSSETETQSRTPRVSGLYRDRNWFTDNGFNFLRCIHTDFYGRQGYQESVWVVPNELKWDLFLHLCFTGDTTCILGRPWFHTVRDMSQEPWNTFGDTEEIALLLMDVETAAQFLETKHLQSDYWKKKALRFDVQCRFCGDIHIAYTGSQCGREDCPRRFKLADEVRKGTYVA